jgi:hypothetical protein
MGTNLHCIVYIKFIFSCDVFLQTIQFKTLALNINNRLMAALAFGIFCKDVIHSIQRLKMMLL